MRIKQFLIAIGVGTMLAACSSDEMQTEKAGGIPINFTANIQNLIPSVGTRFADGTTGMDITSFPEGTTIKVGGTLSSSDTDSYLTNSSGSWTYTSESPKQYLPYDATSKIIAAFYPAPSDGITEMVHSTFYQISSDQSTIENYKSSDLLGAVVTVTKDNAESVNLNFKHIGAKVIVNVKNGSSNVDGYTITMKNVYRSDRMTSTDESIKMSYGYRSDKGPVTFGISSSTAGQAAIIIPQTISSRTALFDVTKDGVTYTFTTTEEITLQSGYSYTFNLYFKNTAIGFANVSISDWGPEPDKPSTIEGDLAQ